MKKKTKILYGIIIVIALILGFCIGRIRSEAKNVGIDISEKFFIQDSRDYIKNMQLASTPGVRPNIQAEAMKNARLAAFQLEAFQKYGGDLSANSRPGGRDITMGQKNVVINVNGAQDPRSTAIETKRVLEQDDINDINNLTATPLKW